VVVLIPQVNPSWVTPLSEAFQAVVWHCLVSHPALTQADEIVGIQCRQADSRRTSESGVEMRRAPDDASQALSW
jgi:hypothetical protein